VATLEETVTRWLDDLSAGMDELRVALEQLGAELEKTLYLEQIARWLSGRPVRENRRPRA
jgi:hypothetical protein